MSRFRFDPDDTSWIPVREDPTLSYKLHYDLKVLGWDRDQGTIDFVLRFPDDGGHCQRHRHLADTTILVLEGEQHLFDLDSSGVVGHRVRPAGEYAHSRGPEDLAHMERGGEEGALVYYGCRTDDGRLFEFLDDELGVLTVVTIDDLIAQWEEAAA